MLKPVFLSFLLLSICFGVFAQKKSVNDTLVVDSNQILRRVKPVNDTIMPQFKGGSYEFLYFLKNHLRYPVSAEEKKISGVVDLSFIVDLNGAISQIKVEKGLGYGCDEEALRVMKKSPRWRPAYKNGQPITVKHKVGVYFGPKRILKFPSVDTQMVYMKFPNYYTNQPEEADYVMFVYPPDKLNKNIYPVKEFYLNGKVKYMGRLKYTQGYTNSTGQCVDYYPNGKKKHVVNYDETGRLTGYQYKFYPNGRLYTETYYGRSSEGNFIVCKDSLGNTLAEHGKGSWIVFDDEFKKQIGYGFIKNQKHDGQWVFWPSDNIKVVEDFIDGNAVKTETYYKVEEHFYSMSEIPMYKSSFQELKKFIYENVKYPSKARKNNVEGLVTLSVIVKPDGHFQELKVVKSLGFDCDEEAIRVVQASGPWVATSILKNPIRLYLEVYFASKYYGPGWPGYVPLVGDGISTRTDGMPRFYN